MFRSLAFNIGLTGLTYFMVSLVGLLLAPLLIGAYGLAGYGQIILARIFLPTATFGFLDLGVGESATRVTATARVDGNWTRASGKLTLLALLSLLVSLSAALPVFFYCHILADWFSVPSDQAAGFIFVLRLTAAAIPLLFLSLIAEGIIKGHEKFGQLRGCELASALIFGGLTLWLLDDGRDANAIALGFLTSILMRALMAMAFALRLCAQAKVVPTRWQMADRVDMIAWVRVMFANKIIGTLQAQIASPLLGLFAGPAAVGLFDAIVRLPRFAKSIYGLTASTVLPQAARLQASDSADGSSKLGFVGTVGSFVLFTPVTLLAMAFGQSILGHWLGADVAVHWPWFSLMLIVPLLNASTSFGGTMLLADYDAARRLNQLSFFQVVAQISLSLGLLSIISPWSFIIGQVASTLLVVPWQLTLIIRNLALDNWVVRWLVVILLSSSILAIGLRWLFPSPNVVELIFLIAIASAVWTSLLALLMVPPQSRQLLFAKLVAWRSGHQ